MEALEKALEGIPETSERVERSDSAKSIISTFKSGRELIPEAAKTREPGEDDE